jgi:hypothetical protein
MYITLDQRHGSTREISLASRRPVKRAAAKKFSPASAVAIFFAGVMVETFGLALIAAYGWVLAGGAIAVCGLVVGAIADRRWPDQGLSSPSVLGSYISAMSSGGPSRKATRRQQG